LIVLGFGALALASLSGTARAAVFNVGDDIIGYYEPVTIKPPCSEYKKQQIFANATASDSSVVVDCNLDMVNVPPVTKMLIVEGNAGSNVVIDCHWNLLTPTQGRTALLIRSKQVSGGWEVPHHVTVRNCEINGIVGVAGTTDGNTASRTMGTGYTAYSQRNAPHHVLLDSLVITSTGDSVYFHSGVTYSTLRNSTFQGNATAPNVYLDAESGHNLIENNRFLAVNTKREVLAIDGSAHNRIVGNYFEGLTNGGIYIYRNCGEIPTGATVGTVRVQEPRRNQIINNVFKHTKYTGEASIFIGSRNRSSDSESFCGKDAGLGYGSSIDNHDFAIGTVVAQNRYSQATPGYAVKNNYPYETYRNEGPVQDQSPRRSGCYVETKAGIKGFVLDGESVAVLTSATQGNRYVCDNGLIWKTGLLNVTVVPFQCSVSNDTYNTGCVVKKECPASSPVKVAVRAVCNLELANWENLSSVAANTVSVARASDTVANGMCYLTDDTTTIGASSGSRNVSSLTGGIGYYIKGSCREYDQNGGDCTIKGELSCL
jgi:hypothetical protein